MIILIFLIIGYSYAQTCHPVCSWNITNNLFPADCDYYCRDVPNCYLKCDNPTNNAICTPICKDPVCSIVQTPNTTINCTSQCNKPKCYNKCPPNGCETEGCPECQVECDPLNCYPKSIESNCSVSCQYTQCSWSCSKSYLKRPKCELFCDSSNICNCRHPMYYPKPSFQISCQPPACAYTGPPINYTHHCTDAHSIKQKVY